MLRRTLLFLSEREGLKTAVLRTSAGRRLARRFVAGESLNDAIEAATRLNQAGFRITLDLLGESVFDRAEAERATAAYVESLERIDDSEARSSISLKLTQLGLDIDERLCVENLGRVVERAGQLGNFVRIDMEGSTHTAATLRAFHSVFPEFTNVGVVIQSYLHRSGDDVAELVRAGAPIRLCKGAYNEHPSVAYQRKSEIDARWIALMKVMLEQAEVPPPHGVPRVALATHDHEMIDASKAAASRMAVDSDRFEFQMLYGVRRDYQTLLVEEGYHMRIYIPYGTQWYPYLMRRMAERPANLAFVARAMLGD